MNRFKLLFFIDSLCAGGAQRQLVELAKHIDRTRFEISFLLYHDNRHFAPELESKGIPIKLIEKGPGFDPRFLVKLILHFRKTKPDIIQSFLKGPNLWARLAGPASGVRHIVSSERNTSIEKSTKWMLIERLTHFASSFIVTPTDSVRQVLVDKIGVNPKKIRVVYSGVDVARFQKPSHEKIEKLRAKFDLTCDDFVLTLAGRMHQQKNHLCLVRSVDVLNKNQDKIPVGRLKVLFVGNEEDQDLRRLLHREIAERGLQENFVFAGAQEDMSEIYALSHAVVLPSLWEGLPNVVLEAMAAARPVIASDVSDNGKMVRHGETGYLFVSDAPEDLARYIAKLIDLGEEARKAMGDAGCRLAREKFSMTTTAASYQAIYNDCLG